MSAGQFTPASAGAGTHTLTYSYTDTSTTPNCTNTCTVSVVVNPLPTAAISYTGSPFCATGTAAVSQTGLAGGSYAASGGVVVNSTTGEIDLVASAGNTGTVTYTFSDGTCDNTATQAITVHPITTVTCGGPYGPYCSADLPIALTGTPSGGFWSGTGVGGNNFDPASATIGNNVLTYSFTDGNGCTFTCTTTIVVNLSPTATISYAGSPYCATGTASVSQTGQAGGAYTGTPGLVVNVTSGDVDLAASSLGAHTVTYSYSDGTCGGVTTANLTIYAQPTVTVSGTYPAFICNTGGAILPLTASPMPGMGETGTWSGPGVTDNADGTGTFNPMALPPGTVTLTYTYTDANGCTGVATLIVDVVICTLFPGIGDPCTCNNDATVAANDGTFGETVAVFNDLNNNGIPEAGEDALAGQTWTVNAQTGAIGVTPGVTVLTYGVIPPASWNPLGIMGYYVIFDHIDAIGYTMTVEGPNAFGDPANLDLSQMGTCSYPNPAFVGIPTTVCVNGGNVAITATNPNGANTAAIAFSGLGITDNGNGTTATLNPVTVGVNNTSTILFEYDPAGNGNTQCLQPIEAEVDVIDCILCTPDNGTPGIGN